MVRAAYERSLRCMRRVTAYRSLPTLARRRPASLNADQMCSTTETVSRMRKHHRKNMWGSTGYSRFLRMSE